MKKKTVNPAASFFNLEIRFEPLDQSKPLEVVKSVNLLPDKFKKQVIEGSQILFLRHWFGIIFSQKITVRNNIFWLHIFLIDKEVILRPMTNALLISLNYMLKGNPECEMNGERFELKEGKYQLYGLAGLIPYRAKFLPGEYISFHTTVPEDIILEMVKVYQDDKKLKQLVESNTKGIFDPHLFKISTVIDKHIKTILRQKTATSSKQLLARNLIWEEQLLGLLNHYIDDKNMHERFQEWNEITHLALEQLPQYITDNLKYANSESRPLLLTNVLRKLGMNCHDFKNAMQLKYGSTWNNFICVIRMETAAKLLTNNHSATIAEIAYSLGYSEPTHFTRAFKKYYKKKPADYKKEKLSVNQSKSIIS